MRAEKLLERAKAILILGVLTASGCGGGGGGSSGSNSTPPPPSAPAGKPTVQIMAPASVGAFSTVTLDATGSRDTAGTLTGYAWKQTSGPTVTQSGADTSITSFVAPNVPAQTTLEFTLT